MRPANLLIIMSDQHNPKALGHAGHPVAKTPNLDRLAESGSRFTAAYTHSPLCVPARAAFATGRYIHETGNWDNASPYDGSVPAWGHRLMQKGHYVRSIGKLHYRSAEDPNGFDLAENAMYVVAGEGDLLGCLRTNRLPLRAHSRESVLKAGRGESSYTRYDDDIAAATVRWLRDEAAGHDKPWVLFCSMVCPHPPKMAPDEFYDLYPWSELPWPVEATASEGWSMHPAVAEFRRAFRWDEPYTEEQIRNALAAYLGQISFLDHKIGLVLDALDASGLADATRVVYTTDHGDNMGNHGLWNKNILYEDAARVPMIMRGPDIPAGVEVGTPVTHLDCFPTIMDAVGLPLEGEDQDLPGTSMLAALRGETRKRPVLLSQYHASGSTCGSFLVRDGSLKYIHHVGLPAQLFDLATDPDEIRDLAPNPAYAAARAACEAALRAVCDPEAIDAAAHAAQAAKVEAAGGRESVLARGTFNGSPVPGEAPDFESRRFVISGRQDGAARWTCENGLRAVDVGVPAPATLAPALRRAPVTTWNDSSAGAPAHCAVLVTPSPGDIACIMCTSGTTGPAKGVLMPHAHCQVTALNKNQRVDLDEDDVYYVCIPLFYGNDLNSAT